MAHHETKRDDSFYWVTEYGNSIQVEIPNSNFAKILYKDIKQKHQAALRKLEVECAELFNKSFK